MMAAIPVLVVTGKVEAIPQLQQVLGATSVFAKPFGVADLLGRVAELTGGPASDGPATTMRQD
jgi:CheY-like chemotaxis protein